MQGLNRSSSRRSLLAAGGGGGAAVAALPALRGAASTPVASPTAGVNGIQPDGTWAFTDDRGVTVSLPAAPERLALDVNVAGALWDFGVRPVGVFGWNIIGEDAVGDAGGNLDVTSVEFLNDAIATIDAERAAAANPDLIVTLVFTGDQLWSVMPEDIERIEQIAPILAISGNSRADIAAGRFAELAAALGIDLEAPAIVEQKAAYDAATKRLEEAVAAKAGMSAIFVAAGETALYVANPNSAGDVMLYRDLGLDVPELPVADGEYWQELSLEEATMYPVDIFFFSLRGVPNTKQGILEHPTMGLHPASQAGQVFPWNQDVILNYIGVATSLDAVSSAVEASDPGIA